MYGLYFKIYITDRYCHSLFQKRIYHYTYLGYVHQNLETRILYCLLDFQCTKYWIFSYWFDI